MSDPLTSIWPADSVMVVTPDSFKDPSFESKLQDFASDVWDDTNNTFTSDHHFAPQRRAVLFAPCGNNNPYKIDLQVGYYTQVLGLGGTPDDVVFADDGATSKNGPFVPALNRNWHPDQNGSCLDTFWRGAENFTSSVTGNSPKYPRGIAPTGYGPLSPGGMQWAVSQACPLRRVHVTNQLYLADGAAYASGGHLANLIVDGATEGGPQQQFFLRNSTFHGQANVGAWSVVYLGCNGEGLPVATTKPTSGSGAVTRIDQPQVRLEKPYIALSSNYPSEIKYELHVPKPQFYNASRTDYIGANFTRNTQTNDQEFVRDFSNVAVVASKKGEDPTKSIQDALDAGKDVVLAPGIFALSSTIVMKKENQVLLGIGMATMTAPPGGSKPCVYVPSGIAGIRIAGITFEASERSGGAFDKNDGSCLLEWGEPGKTDAGKKDNPGGLFDVFCRVGGAAAGDRKNYYVSTMVRLHSGNIIGDNLWLWRADHAQLNGDKPNYPDISPLYWQTDEDEFRVETGFEVNGDDVTIYGLAVEHANGHQTVWKGERGMVAFYQCELPYGATQEGFGDVGYRGYLVHKQVKHHKLYAPGVYSNFRNERVLVSTAMEHPIVSTVEIVNPFTIRLDCNFGIQTVINGTGGMANQQGRPVRPS